MALPLPRLVVLALVAGPALAGCVGGDRGDDDPAPPSPTPASPSPTDPTTPTPAAAKVTAPVPWWDVGEYWTMDLTRGGETRTYELVHMWNDSDSSHFWLGVADRGLAVEHALFDTNPFLGRIHHDLLAPHESGQHAIMYDFPLDHGKRWRGMLLGGDWEFEATEDAARAGRFLVVGEGADGSIISYDYEPTTQWFTVLEIQDADGAKALSATVTEHGVGASGTFWFERGRDYYAGPEVRQGPVMETFTVEDEGLHFLAIRFDLEAGAPLEIQVVDPAGAVLHREAYPTGEVATLVELAAPAAGEWTIRYVTPGAMTGDVVAVGMFETKKVI